jgi:sRNA-binding carbon storage regulator CsrA
MLVLSRKEDQGVSIRNTATNEVIRVVVCGVAGKRVSLGIDAKKSSYEIVRDEIAETTPKHLGAAESP